MTASARMQGHVSMIQQLQQDQDNIHANVVLDSGVSFVMSPCGLSGRLGVHAVSIVARGRKPGQGAVQEMTARVPTKSQKNKTAQWIHVVLIIKNGSHGDLVQRLVALEHRLELEIA